MSVTLISVSQDTVVSNKHEERTRHYYVIFSNSANVIFIDRKWVEEKGLPKRPLCHPISMYNVNGTKNSAGQITHCMDITITYQEHKE